MTLVRDIAIKKGTIAGGVSVAFLYLLVVGLIATVITGSDVPAPAVIILTFSALFVAGLVAGFMAAGGKILHGALAGTVTIYLFLVITLMMGAPTGKPHFLYGWAIGSVLGALGAVAADAAVRLKPPA